MINTTLNYKIYYELFNKILIYLIKLFLITIELFFTYLNLYTLSTIKARHCI